MDAPEFDVDFSGEYDLTYSADVIEVRVPAKSRVGGGQRREIRPEREHGASSADLLTRKQTLASEPRGWLYIHHIHGVPL